MIFLQVTKWVVFLIVYFTLDPDYKVKNVFIHHLNRATLKWSFYISFCPPSAHPPSAQPSDHKKLSLTLSLSDVRPGANPIRYLHYNIWTLGCIIQCRWHTNVPSTHFIMDDRNNQLIILGHACKFGALKCFDLKRFALKCFALKHFALSVNIL